jgi:hypothetical protein
MSRAGASCLSGAAFATAYEKQTICRIDRRVSPPAHAEGGTQPTQVGLDVSRGFAQPRIIRLKASQSARTIGRRDLSVDHAPTPFPLHAQHTNANDGRVIPCVKYFTKAVSCRQNTRRCLFCAQSRLMPARFSHRAD